MTEELTWRAERLAKNEALYREVNEQIAALNEAFDAAAGIGGEWVCECSNTECTVMVKARFDEYEAVRSNPRRFIVYPGHVDLEIEHVTEETERFTIVEKLGEAARVAESTDPRAAHT
jgi:hypothetical protein